MALLALSGIGVLSAEILMPRVGVWHGSFVLDSTTVPSGSVTVATDDGGFSLVGRVVFGGASPASSTVRVVGGAGGLPTLIPPKAYQQAPVRLVLSDILSACGERASAASDAGTLSRVLRSWTTRAGTGAEALARLLEATGASHRVLPDGTHWIGTDAYPPAPKREFDILEWHLAEGRIVLASDRPFLLPGTTLTLTASTGTQTVRVSSVAHDVDPSHVRTTAWVEP